MGGSRIAVPNIQERRKSEIKRLVETGSTLPDVALSSLQYQPGAAPGEFRIRRMVFRSRAATGSPASEICYGLRRGAQGLVITSTVTHPLTSNAVRVTPAARPVTEFPLGANGLPTEVELTNGVRLHEVSVDFWQLDTVTLRHVAGVDPIKLDRIIPAQRTLFESQLMERIKQQRAEAYRAAVAAAAQDRVREAAEAQQQVADNQQQAQQQQANKLEEEAGKHHLLVGMTMDQARRAWGQPNESNSISSAVGPGAIWYYYGRGTDSHGNATDAQVRFMGDTIISMMNVKTY